MRIHWDLTLGYIVRTPKSSTRLGTLEFKRGDAASLELVFYANAMPVLLQPGHAIRFALKPKGHYDGEPLVYTATFTEDTTAKTYTAEPSFNTTALTALFASPNAPDRADLIGEFSLRNGDDTHGWQSSQTLQVCVMNDVIRGQEGTPGAATDSQQSWQWLLASLAAGANATLTPNHEARVLTLAAESGASGNGWSPLFGIVSDGERCVLQLTSWVGGTGDEPQGSGHYLGAAGLVASISDAVDLRGAAGANGGQGGDGQPGLNGTHGLDGNNGWSPVLALMSDGERRVLQLIAWTGGSGSTPAGSGSYLGAAGWVATAAEALDLRGTQGPPGSNGVAGSDVTPITSISFDGISLTIQTSSGQSFGPFTVKGNDGGTGSSGSDGMNGTHGWSPLFAIISHGERRVLQLQSWTGGSGSTPGNEGYYVSASGLSAAIEDAVDLRGERGGDGSAGAPGSNGSDATSITSIDFDGANLTIHTSAGQSFGPFYVRGSDGSSGSDGTNGNHGWSPLFAIITHGERRVLQLQSWSGGSGSTPGNEGYYVSATGLTTSIEEAVNLRGQSGTDATPITNISFDGANLTIYTSSGQSFGPFYVRGNDGGNGSDGGSGSNGNDGANGTNGWSPLFAVISDSARRVLQLQSWTGGSGSTPGSEGYYLGASGLTSSINDAADISGGLASLAPIADVLTATSLSGNDAVDVAQLEAQIADLKTKLQLVLDRLRSHNLISAV